MTVGADRCVRHAFGMNVGAHGNAPRIVTTIRGGRITIRPYATRKIVNTSLKLAASFTSIPFGASFP